MSISPHTVLFWWTATITAQPTDSIVLGKLLPPPDATSGTASPIPQSIAAMPLAHRAYYPAAYLPITYDDLSTYAQSRAAMGLPELGRENIQKRGALIAALRIEAANHYLNWNQTAKQRQRQLRSMRIFALLPGKAEALSIDCSPLFAEEPPVRYRGSAIVTNKADKGRAKARGRGGRAGGPSQPTLRAVVSREEAARNGRAISPEIHPPHIPVTTRHRPLPPLVTQPLPAHRLDYQATDAELREWCDIQPDDALLDRVPGMAKDITVPPTFCYPQCCVVE